MPAGRGNDQDVSLFTRVPALAPFRISSFRYQWPADLLASWAFEMEGVILGWFVLVETGSVLALAIFGSLQFLGTLISPLFAMVGDRIGYRNLLCLMRATYVIAAVALMVLFLTGLAAPVPVFILATVIGLPIGLAAYFWANRLLPTDITNRGAWEVHVMFITWGLAFLYAGLRPLNRAWLEISVISGLAYGFIPVLNALTTQRHLGITIPAGDWALAGIDLASFAIAAFFVMLAWSAWRKHAAVERISGDDARMLKSVTA